MYTISLIILIIDKTECKSNHFCQATLQPVVAEDKKIFCVKLFCAMIGLIYISYQQGGDFTAYDIDENTAKN
jgi:hypothetical protein